MRILWILFIATIISSCKSKTNEKILEVKIDTLKAYQQYSLDILKKVTADDVGYAVSDSFRLWTDGFVNNKLEPFYTTKTINDGFYSYIFWKKINDSFTIYKETQASKVGFVSDSLYDVNGDSYKDFVITDNTMNGQCQPTFSQLFCFDSDKEEFVIIEMVNSLPNVTFQPNDKTVSGEWECKMTKDFYKFKWINNMRIDTIYYKTINL